jgi:hypothetical protein
MFTVGPTFFAGGSSSPPQISTTFEVYLIVGDEFAGSGSFIGPGTLGSSGTLDISSITAFTFTGAGPNAGVNLTKTNLTGFSPFNTLTGAWDPVVFDYGETYSWFIFLADPGGEGSMSSSFFVMEFIPVQV